jgi:rubredoxin
MSDFNKYECVICGYIYDESVGIPDDGIPAGTKWADIPEDWECPDCGNSKFDFDLLED